MAQHNNVIVLGNCQARPVATYLFEMSGGTGQYTPLIAHLSSQDHMERDMSLLDKADLILTQPIADSFTAPHLATSRLKDRYADAVTTWPNLFFSGQTPDIVSLKDDQGTTIMGPLETYQSAGVFNCWKKGMTSSQTIAYLRERLPFSDTTLSSTIEKSHIELSQREHLIDVSMTDYILENVKNKRMFFTFNHPTSDLLIELCKRICIMCQIVVKKPLISEFWEEPLGRLTAPTTQPLANWLGLQYPSTDACKGRVLEIKGSNVVLGGKMIYAFDQFVQSSYSALDCQLSKDQRVTFTPSYAALEAGT